MTRKAQLLALLPLALALYMLFMGVGIFRSFHPADPIRYAFGAPPLLIAGAILATLFTIPRRMIQGRVTIRESGVEWDPGKHDLNLHFPWGDMLFSAPRSRQQMVRSLLLVHRDKKLVLYDFFLPGFDQLVHEISRRKAKYSSVSADAGLRIDSGRVGSRGR